jgi:RHS repeat-associated protein
VVDTTDTGSTVNYVTADGLNTPRVIADGNGSTVWTWNIAGNPFGEQPPTSSTGYVYNLRFPGQYFDGETGRHYNVNRYFDRTIGGFTQVDPMGFAGGQASLYAYVNGNPLSDVDPLGLQGVMGPLPSLGPYPSNLTAQQKNIIVNSAAQLVPGVGLVMVLSNYSFTPYSEGTWFTDNKSSAWDVQTGLLSTLAGAANSSWGNKLANDYMMSNYSNRSTGNKALRRQILGANNAMWSIGKGMLDNVGKILGPVGFVVSYINMAEELRAAGSGCAG